MRSEGRRRGEVEDALGRPSSLTLSLSLTHTHKRTHTHTHTRTLAACEYWPEGSSQESNFHFHTHWQRLRHIQGSILPTFSKQLLRSQILKVPKDSQVKQLFAFSGSPCIKLRINTLMKLTSESFGAIMLLILIYNIFIDFSNVFI